MAEKTMDGILLENVDEAKKRRTEEWEERKKEWTKYGVESLADDEVLLGEGELPYALSEEEAKEQASALGGDVRLIKIRNNLLPAHPLYGIAVKKSTVFPGHTSIIKYFVEMDPPEGLGYKPYIHVKLGFKLHVPEKSEDKTK